MQGDLKQASLGQLQVVCGGRSSPSRRDTWSILHIAKCTTFSHNPWSFAVLPCSGWNRTHFAPVVFSHSQGLGTCFVKSSDPSCPVRRQSNDPQQNSCGLSPVRGVSPKGENRSPFPIGKRVGLQRFEDSPIEHSHGPCWYGVGRPVKELPRSAKGRGILPGHKAEVLVDFLSLLHEQRVDRELDSLSLAGCAWPTSMV